MDHSDVTNARDLPSRYLRGELDEAEELAFEAHFLDCQACLDELELARDFARDVRATAVADAARQVVASRLLGWWLTRAAGTRRALAAGLVGALALGILGPAWWLGRENRRLTEQVAQQAAANAAGQAATGQLERQLREAEDRERQSAAALAAREAQLQARLERPAAPEPPRADLPVFLLALVRSGSVSEPIEIEAPPTGSFALALDPGPASASARFRVVVLDAQNRQVYQQEDLRPNALEVLLVVFPAGFLTPGRYHLELAERDGATWRGRGRWPFTVR